MTDNQIIIAIAQIILYLILITFVVWSNTVIKQRLKSQDNINEKMKSFMEIFSIDELKKFVDVRTETMQLNLENYIEKNKKEFAENAEPYIREVLQADINNSVSQMQERYDEICEGIYNLLVTIPMDKRKKFIENHLKITGNEFIKELKKYNEWEVD